MENSERLIERTCLFHDIFSHKSQTFMNPLRRRSVTAHSFLKRKISSETGFNLAHLPGLTLGSKPSRAARHSSITKLHTSAAAGPWPAAANRPLGLDRADLRDVQTHVGLVQDGGHVQHLTTDLESLTNSIHDLLKVFLKTEFFLKNNSHLGIVKKVDDWSVLNELSPIQIAEHFIQNSGQANCQRPFTRTSRSPTQNQSLRKDRNSDKTPFIVINLNLSVILYPQQPHGGTCVRQTT